MAAATTYSPADIQAKIASCVAIIENDGAPQGEKAAARDALARLRAKLGALGKDHRFPGKVCGAKYAQTRHLPLREVAALIRADIEAARKRGRETARPGAVAVPNPISDAPAQIKFSVRLTRSSGMARIDVYVKNIPREWGTGGERGWASDALVELGAALREIVAAYNYHGDCGRRFYSTVMTQTGTGIPDH